MTSKHSQLPMMLRMICPPNDIAVQRRAREGGAQRRPTRPSAATAVWPLPLRCPRQAERRWSRSLRVPGPRSILPSGSYRTSRSHLLPLKFSSSCGGNCRAALQSKIARHTRQCAIARREKRRDPRNRRTARLDKRGWLQVEAARSRSPRARAATSESAYAGHRPEDTVLYRQLAEHWRSFLATIEEEDGAGGRHGGSYPIVRLSSADRRSTRSRRTLRRRRHC